MNKKFKYWNSKELLPGPAKSCKSGNNIDNFFYSNPSDYLAIITNNIKQ